MESPVQACNRASPQILSSNTSTTTEPPSICSINGTLTCLPPNEVGSFPVKSSSPLLNPTEDTPSPPPTRWYLRPFQHTTEDTPSPPPTRWYLRPFQHMGIGSMRGSVFLLVNSALGAGLLTLPYAMNLAGVIFAIFLISLHGLVAAYTAYVLTVTIAHFGRGTYSEISRWVLGPKWAIAVDTVITLNGVGMCMTLFVFLGDFVPQSLEPFNLPLLFHNRTFLLTICLVIMWPIAIQRYLGPLKFISFSIIICLLIVVVIVVCKMVPLFHEANKTYDVNYISVNWSFFNYYTVILFSYSQHMSVCPIAEEMKNKTHQRIVKMVGRAFTTEYLLYLSYAIFGYFSWLGGTHQNFMTNYKIDDYFILFSRFLLSFMLIITLPLNIIAACRSFIVLRQKLKKFLSRSYTPNINSVVTQEIIADNEESNFYRSLNTTNLDDEQPIVPIQVSPKDVADPSEYYITRIVGATLILLSGYIVAIITDKVAVVVGYMGGTLANSLVLLFPSFLYLYGPSSKHHSPHLKYSLFTLLMIMTMTGYISTIAQILQGVGLLPYT